MKVQLPKDKYDSITTKEELLEAMREPVKSALNLLLDTLYNRKDLYDEISKSKDLTEEEKNDIIHIENSCKVYEELREKLINKKELSNYDYNLVGLVCATVATLMGQNIENLKFASTELKRIGWKIVHLKLDSKEDNKKSSKS